MYFVLLVGVTLWLNSLVFKRLYGLYDSFLYYCLSLLKATWRVAHGVRGGIPDERLSDGIVPNSCVGKIRFYPTRRMAEVDKTIRALPPGIRSCIEVGGKPS